MDQKRQKNGCGVSTVEYMILLVFCLAALVLMSGPVQRAIQGRWKATADTFGQGRQFEPSSGGAAKRTRDYFFDADTQDWISQYCFDQRCDCSFEEIDPAYDAQCVRCKAGCRVP